MYTVMAWLMMTLFSPFWCSIGIGRTRLITRYEITLGKDIFDQGASVYIPKGLWDALDKAISQKCRIWLWSYELLIAFISKLVMFAAKYRDPEAMYHGYMHDRVINDVRTKLEQK